MAHLVDEEKQEIINKVIEAINKKVKPAQAKPIIEFVRQFYGTTSAEDLNERNLIDLYGSLLSFWDFIEKRKAGEMKLRVFNPDYEEHGWQSTHTIVEVIADDSPFLVDSIAMEISRMGLNIHYIIHMGGLKVQRDADGRLQNVLPANGNGDNNAKNNCIEEAPIYIEIDRQTDPNVLNTLKHNLENILKNVRAAVSDWQAMRQHIQNSLSELEKNKLSCDEIEITESKDFLKWIVEDHFTILGCRDYEFVKKGNDAVLKAVANTSLGLLRDEKENIIPLDFSANSPQVKRLLASPNQILWMAKTDIMSHVHRPAYMDFIGIRKFNDKGEIIGETWIIGLYTASAYNTSPRYIPLLRDKIAKILKLSNIAPRSHAGKALINILETLPRDDLFQARVSELLSISLGILHMQERQRIRFFMQRNHFSSFISCLVYVPREQFNIELRRSMEEILKRAFHSNEISFSTRFSDSVLARIHFIVRVSPDYVVDCDLKEIEQKLIDIGRSWKDQLRDNLIDQYGEEHGNLLVQRYGSAFPSSYREAFSARSAVYDIRHMENILAGKPIDMNVYQPVEDTENLIRFKLYQLNQSIPLSDVLPILENMGLRVLSERSHEIVLSDGNKCWLNDFGMYYDPNVSIDVTEIKDNFHAAFENIWLEKTENDRFNKLVLGAGLSWREIIVFRAYAKYCKQIGFTFSQSYIEDTLLAHADIVKSLMTLFKWRFDPAQVDKIDKKEIQKLEQKILTDLDNVTNLDQDRILRRYLDLIKATLRTNYFQTNDKGQLKEYLSFKFNSQMIPELPLPRPMFEIYVYSPRFEGIHLRGAKVARGGLRWSDRREDFRTEVLGLMKAQQVKNAVIVPGGAKGGFVTKMLTATSDRETVLTEGIACYQNFIRGLLDITDNLVNGNVVPPQNVVRYDEDDPYLVVAADKGTATFSNIANEISTQYNFWLGDAFASGGSMGYDHKKMGITAKGAWESVKRHFRELDINIQTTDFTVIGIGDMAGDVFGNGMLLSKHIKLVAVFNHQHIFLDPDPDPEKSFKERERLFNLPRSAWSDYNSELISKGGGIFSRSEKSIKLSPEVKKLLNVHQDSMIPNDLIRAILKAPVDLLWNGGIGTFVKSTQENNMDVGDRTNDPLRINASELRCKVVGEGGNLGFTQLARIEYQIVNDGRIFTDFIDNSAGVDCSDHEVNIKILLDAIVTNGDLTVKQRNQLLSEMTDEVAELVLRDNYTQTLAISLAAVQAPINLDLHMRYIEELERAGKLDRALEFLPDTKTLMERKLAGKGLSRPSIAILMAYTKSIVKQELLKTDVPEDLALSHVIEKEFPKPLRAKFRQQMEQHRLHREIIATQLVNQMIDEMGFTFVYRLHDETGAPTSAIVRAYYVARNIFNLNNIWEDISALDYKVSSELQVNMYRQVIRLLRRGTRWFLRNRRMHLDIAQEIAHFTPGVTQICEHLPEYLVGNDLANYQETIQRYTSLGVPSLLATRLACAQALFSALDIIEAAIQYTFSISDLASVYFAVGEQLELGWIRSQVIERVVENHWESLSREALRDDLDWQQRQLAISVLGHENGGKAESREVKFKNWMEKYHALIERWHYVLSELRAATSLNFTMFFVATRELLDLTQTCFQVVDICALPHAESGKNQPANLIKTVVEKKNQTEDRSKHH